MIGRNFILGGKAIFTVSNGKGDHYTFRVTHKEGNAKYGPVWFVSVLSGPDNTASYTYLGMLDAEMGVVKLTAKSAFADDSPAVKVLRWAVRQVYDRKELPAGYAIQHNGQCARCARMLTVPESIDSGFGPECMKKVCMAA